MTAQSIEASAGGLDNWGHTLGYWELARASGASAWLASHERHAPTPVHRRLASPTQYRTPSSEQPPHQHNQRHQKAPHPSFVARPSHCTHQEVQQQKQPPQQQKGKHATAASPPPPPAAAFIFAGHARTFILDAVHEAMLSNAVLSFGADAYNFFVLGADDPGSTKGNLPVRSDEASVRKAVALLNPVAFVYEAADSPTSNATPVVPADCVLSLGPGKQVGDGYHRVVAQPWWLGWWQTWHKLSRAFELVRGYETSHAPWRFDWVVRLRPDAWFFSPSFAYCEVDPSEGIVTPAGVAGCSGRCVNDHLAWVPRAWAEPYFLGATPELEQCHGSAFLDTMHDYGYHLRYRLERQHVPFASARLVPYTIVRACGTSRNRSTIGSAAPACKRVTMDNVFTQGHPGIGQLRNARQWRAEQHSQCLIRWPNWPGAVGAECRTTDHVG